MVRQSHPQGPLGAADGNDLEFGHIPFRGIIEQSLAGIYLVFDERFQYVNRTFAAMFGYTPAEFVGTRIQDLVMPDAVEDAMENYRLRIAGQVPSVHYFTRCRHRMGHVVHLEIHGSGVDYEGRRALTGVAIDVSRRVQQEQELVRSRERLRELAAYINSSREELRAALAREVHDVLGGMLSSIRMDVSRIQRRAQEPALAEIRDIAADLMALTQETIDTARKISDELRPSVLDHLGLVAAIRAELSVFAQRHELRSQFVVDGPEPMLSADHATQCFRIFQEALTNIGRHAAASEVAVRLKSDGQEFEMEVADNGVGIDPWAMRVGSIGMLSMSERARGMGGSLKVVQQRDGGTCVRLTVPMPRAGQGGDD